MSPHTKNHPLIPHLRGREKGLEPFGWTPEDTEWIAMVCLNSGVFTRGQYLDFFAPHTNTARSARFVQSLITLKLAVQEPIPIVSPANRPPLACRITYKPIYRALGIPNVRLRRLPDPPNYLRRLLSLDYVIDHPELHWLPTESEKVAFCTHYGVDPSLLPRRLYGGAGRAVTRYFPLKLPIGAVRSDGVRVCTFVYIDPGNGTPSELRNWGQAHEHIWATLKQGGFKIHVAATTVRRFHEPRTRNILERWAKDQNGIRGGDWREPELREEFETLSRALDPPDQERLRPFGGYKTAHQRYMELKDALDKPPTYNIRIDTFEIWRSQRIVPNGAHVDPDRT